MIERLPRRGTTVATGVAPQADALATLLRGTKSPIGAWLTVFWNFLGPDGELLMSATSFEFYERVMTLPVNSSDDELLRLMVAGDEEAFTIIYRRSHGGVYRFALHMSGCPSLAEDVTQEVFVVLISEGDRFDPSKGSLASYLYGIARNHVLRKIQRDRLLVPLEGDSDDSGSAPPAFVLDGDPLSDLTRGETISAVRNAILSLPVHYREAVVLCDLQEMGYAEAASTIGCAVGTVRSRLHRGRAILIDKLRASDSKGTASGEVSPTRCFA